MNSPPEPEKASHPVPGMRPPAPPSPGFLAWEWSDQKAGPIPSASEIGGRIPPGVSQSGCPLPPLRAVSLPEQSCLRPQAIPHGLVPEGILVKIKCLQSGGGVTLSVPHPQPGSWCT